MKHLKNYRSFLNEAKINWKQFRKEMQRIPLDAWEVVWGEDGADGYRNVAAEYKGKYYLSYGGVVSAGSDLEDVDLDMGGEPLSKEEYDNLEF